jgi:PAS domain S-box-containing protein
VLGNVSQDVGKAGFSRSLIHPNDWQPFLDHLNGLGSLSEDQTAEFEFRWRDSSGLWRWLHTRDKVFSRNEDGSVREIMSTTVDITERRNAEDETRFMYDLDRAVMPLSDLERDCGRHGADAG